MLVSKEISDVGSFYCLCLCLCRGCSHFSFAYAYVTLMLVLICLCLCASENQPYVPELDSGGMFKYYDQPKVGVLSTRLSRRYGFLVRLAEQICHGSSKKEWRKISFKDCVYPWCQTLSFNLSFATRSTDGSASSREKRWSLTTITEELEAWFSLFRFNFFLNSPITYFLISWNSNEWLSRNRRNS